MNHQDVTKTLIESVDALVGNIMPNVPTSIDLKWSFMPHQIVITIKLPPLANLSKQPELPE